METPLRINRTIRILSLLSICLLLSFTQIRQTRKTTAAPKFKEAKKMQLSYASKQHWFGGIKGSGNGINYVIKIFNKNKKPVSYDTVWINSRPFIPDLVRSKDNPPGVIELHCFFKRLPDGDQIKEIPEKSEKAPPSLAPATIYVTIGKDRRVFYVNKFDKLRDIYAP